MVPEVLYRVCYGTPRPTPFQTSLLTFQPALLPGFIRRKVRYNDYPGITPAKAPACVRGTYVYGLTDGDMWRIKIFEGSQYELRKIKVKLLRQRNDVEEGSRRCEGEGEGEEKREENGEAEAETYDLLERKYDDAENEEVETNTYVYTAGDTRLEDGEWNFEEFKRDKLVRWTGLDEEYEGECHVKPPRGFFLLPGSLPSFQ